MYIVIEIIKFSGVLLSTAVAIAAAYLSDTKSVESGKLTKKGQLLVSAALSGLLLSAGGQIVQMIDSRASAEATRIRNEKTAARLEKIPQLILRTNYPLEPLELFFEIEYPMDQEHLKSYAERVGTDIAAFLKRSRGRNVPIDLATETMGFVITHKKEWQPTDGPLETSARDLLEDSTTFAFSDAADPGNRQVQFLSVASGIQDIIVTMKKQGEVVQNIELVADFPRRVFIKRVWCRNPVRAGSDSTAVSPLDLVGRELTWSAAVSTNLAWSLRSFAMRFSYDYGFSQNHRQLPSGRRAEVAGSKSVRITGAHVGLTDILSVK